MYKSCTFCTVYNSKLKSFTYLSWLHHDTNAFLFHWSGWKNIGSLWFECVLPISNWQWNLYNVLIFAKLSSSSNWGLSLIFIDPAPIHPSTHLSTHPPPNHSPTRTSSGHPPYSSSPLNLAFLRWALTLQDFFRTIQRHFTDHFNTISTWALALTTQSVLVCLNV